MMSAMERLASLLLFAMTIGEAYAKSKSSGSSGGKKKKKISVGAIVGVIIVVIIIIIVICIILFLLKRSKAKKAAKAGHVETAGHGGEGYAMAGQGQKYEPVTSQHPPQGYQQQTNYPQQTPYGQGPQQQHGAAGDYYKP